MAAKLKHATKGRFLCASLIAGTKNWVLPKHLIFKGHTVQLSRLMYT